MRRVPEGFDRVNGLRIRILHLTPVDVLREEIGRPPKCPGWPRVSLERNAQVFPLNDVNLNGRELGTLGRAREHGYLDQRNQVRESLLRAYERWCWTMKIPIVRIRRRSPRSRYCVVLLEMYTTPNTLSVEGQQAMARLGEKGSRHGDLSLSAYGGEFGGIPAMESMKFARELFRVATTLAYYIPDMALLEARRRKFGQAHQERRRAAIA